MGRAIDASSRNSQYSISFLFLGALISKAAKPLAKEIGQVTMEDKGRHHKRMHVFLRALPEKGGWGLPLPNFFFFFFHQV